MKKELYQSLDWDVVKTPLAYAKPITKTETFGEQEFPVQLVNAGANLGKSHFALNRNDDGSLITVHKGSYNPLTNASFLEFVEQFSQISRLKIDGYDDFKNGNVVLAYLDNPRGFEINGHVIKDKVVIGNSHDGSTSTFVGTTTDFLRCENEFSKIIKQGVIRHTSNRDEKIQEVLRDYEFYFQQRDAMYDGFIRMGNHVVGDELRESLVDTLLDIEDRQEMSTRKTNILSDVEMSLDREMSDLGENLWGFFNGITYYTTHVKQVSDRTKSTVGAVVGAKANLNRKAHELCLKQMTTAMAM